MFLVRNNVKKIGLHLLKWYGIWIVLFCLTILINLILGINLTNELNGKISNICFYISAPLYLIINYFIRNMKNKNNEKVKHVSTKYNKVVELNKKVVVVELLDISQEEQDKFKRLVVDSDLIEFRKGEKRKKQLEIEASISDAFLFSQKILKLYLT